MQAVRRGWLGPLLLCVVPAWAQSDWAEVDLGSFPVPRACPGVGLVPRDASSTEAQRQPRQQPQQQQQQQRPQQQQAVTWSAGRVQLSMRAWPDQRLRDRQSIRSFTACARSVATRVPASQLVGPERAAEAAIKAAIEQCLLDNQQPIPVRTVVLSRSSMQCPSSG